MALLAFGINHKTAPLALREQVVFMPENTPGALQDLLRQKAVNEAVILSTCNRTELYTDALEADQVADWLAEQRQMPKTTLLSHAYAYQDQQAISHLMRVASGLDSMVLGESQILGQLKSAYAVAEQAGTVGQQLARLFQTVFAVTKQIRTQTGIGANPISVAYMSVQLAKRIFANLNNCTALLIGAGDTIDLVATHLQSHRIKKIIIANRDENKAAQLAEKFNGSAISIAEIPTYLFQAEIVVSATASQLPLLGKGAVESAIKQRKRRPILMLDLAVPRDIEAEVAELEDIFLYNIDDLGSMITENLKLRGAAAQTAETVITAQAQAVMRILRAQDAAATIRAYRDKVQQLSQQQLELALQELRQGRPAEEVLQKLTHRLTNKILHTPTVQIRQAASEGETELLWLAKQLLEV